VRIRAGIEADGLDEIERGLAWWNANTVASATRGAAMTLTILDVLPFGRRDRTAGLLDGPARPHISSPTSVSASPWCGGTPSGRTSPNSS
jgi:hypothetical protein